MAPLCGCPDRWTIQRQHTSLAISRKLKSSSPGKVRHQPRLAGPADGLDLGLDIPFGKTRDEARADDVGDRPYWDGNETWPVIVGASLFAALVQVARPAPVHAGVAIGRMPFARTKTGCDRHYPSEQVRGRILACPYRGPIDGKELVVVIESAEPFCMQVPFVVPQ